ncbi:MAG TPA: hypothetical protein VEK12_07505 [Alphaproteobacteria bacterium]|nr:hypothetical protein [Alphaproteobacteria bacterium]
MQATDFACPAKLEPDENGERIVSSRDLPEALTSGHDEPEALTEAAIAAFGGVLEVGYRKMA